VDLDSASGIDEKQQVSALRFNLNFSLLLGGSTVSMFANRIVTLAYPLLVFAETRSALAAGWVGFAGLIPSAVFYLPAGVLVERWNSRRTMLFCEAGRGLIISAIVIVLLIRVSGVWLLIAAAFIEGTFSVFYYLSELRLIPVIVPSAQTSSALARIQARNSIASLLGRAISGFLYGLGRVVPFLVDALSFVMSVGTLALMRLPMTPSKKRADGVEVRIRDIGCALRQVRGDHYLAPAMVLLAMGNVAIQALLIVFIVGEQSRGTSPFAIGLAFAATGIGGTLGSVTANALFKRYRYRLLILTLWTWMVAMAVLLVTVTEIAFAATVGVYGLAGTVANVVVGSYMYRRIPESMLSRVMSIDALIGFSGSAIGAPIGGALFRVFGLRKSCAALFLFTVLITVAATAVRDLRSPPQNETTPELPSESPESHSD
jgi:MFS family permease